MTFPPADGVVTRVLVLGVPPAAWWEGYPPGTLGGERHRIAHELRAAGQTATADDFEDKLDAMLHGGLVTALRASDAEDLAGVVEANPPQQRRRMEGS